MAAPLGFKTFNTGDVLSAADTNGYLMQGIWVFADATARDAAVTSPQEGNSCYLKDTDVIQVYSGSSWVVKSGGSSPLTTKGDLYTYSTTDARLAVGANGTTLVADSSTATGLKWDTPAAGGGMTLIETLALTSGSSVTSSTIAGTYTDLQIIIRGALSNNNSAFSMRFNGDTGSNYTHYYIRNDSSTITGVGPTTGTDIALNGATDTTAGYLNVYYNDMYIRRYADSNFKSVFQTQYMGEYPGFYMRYALWNNTSAITSVTIKCDGGNFAAGNAYIYGVK